MNIPVTPKHEDMSLIHGVPKPALVTDVCVGVFLCVCVCVCVFVCVWLCLCVQVC